MDKLRRFQRLSAHEQWLLVQGVVLLPVVSVALRLGGFRRCQAALSRLARGKKSTGSSVSGASIERARDVVRIVQAATRHGLCRATCLEQSLVLWWLLLRRGIPADLRMGVRKAERGVEAHAWVELGGVVLNDTDDVHQRYAPFDRDIAAVTLEER